MEKFYNNVLIALALILSEMVFQLYISCFACHIFLFVTLHFHFNWWIFVHSNDVGSGLLGTTLGGDLIDNLAKLVLKTNLQTEYISGVYKIVYEVEQIKFEEWLLL